MNSKKIKKFKEKLFFNVGDVSNILDVKRSSARVLCNRYVKKGIFTRLKRNFYILNKNFKDYSREDLMKIANYLQVPSYISLTTALMEWNITSQVQVNTFESCCKKRSKVIEEDGQNFRYFKLKDKYYFGFFKKDGIFIAGKEKAFLDAVYLYTFGKYSLDFSALEVNKLDENIIEKLLVKYPERTRKKVKEICVI
ncbi:MAG: type IV toxin-antitoxin system AbiEi family antitoxin domain-containing protein [Elusimicrobiota bacterium]